MKHIIHGSLLIVLCLAGSLRAQEKKAADVLPASVVLYAEAPKLKNVVDLVLEHPLRKRIESLNEYRQAVGSKGYRQFLIGLNFVETQLGRKWRPAVEDLTAGGVHFAVDAKTNGVVVLAKARDETFLQKSIDTFLLFVKNDAINKGVKSPIKEGEYRDVQAYEFNQVRFARLGSWFVMTNNGDLGKSVIDAFKDGRDDSLAKSEQFVTARKKVEQGRPALWAYVNVEMVRASGKADAVFSGRADNPLGELLVGGLLSSLQKTPYATAALHMNNKKIGLSVSAPHDAAWVPEQREYFFGPQGKGRAPEISPVKNLLLGLSTYRDISQMWMRAGDLFDEGTNDGLAQADSNLSTLFSGRDFGEDILGAVHPELQLLVTRQTFDVKKGPVPAIKLPSFAIVARLRKPDEMKRELRRIFQSLIGFLNVTGAMNGQPQLDLDIVKEGEAQIVTSTYAPEPDEKASEEARINFNFSPSVGFVKDLFVISSTKQLAQEITQLAGRVKQASSDSNTFVRANARALRDVLADNRSHLVAQNILEEGSTKEEAEAQIGILLEILNVFDHASLSLDNVQNTLQLKLNLELSDAALKGG